jgi:7,8-didemethyl-8-hydroxy-5-deazariboflavin synthase
MRVLTYSKNIFIPVTDLCRNRCGYCSFRRDLGRARIIKRSQAQSLMERGAKAGCTEALFSMGESPWEVPGFSKMARDFGISDLMEYLVELCEAALEMGLLPHTNAGVLCQDHLELLAPYNASMGLMLETTAGVLAHEGSPGKAPEVRIDFMARAGKMKIPFTTGLLIGIGEGWPYRLHSLKALADLHRTYGHLQEVIIQPFDPKPGTPMAGRPGAGDAETTEVIRLARSILPEEVAIQSPPNLADPEMMARAGASDLGGISSITPDGINPDRPWPDIAQLKDQLKGYSLRERLPIYPRYVLVGWYSRRVAGLIEALADEDGYKRTDGAVSWKRSG